jgi:hypothetical protein
MPPWSPNLPELGAIDSGQIRPEDLESLLESDTDTSVVDGGTVPPTTPTDDTAPDTTVAGG